MSGEMVFLTATTVTGKDIALLLKRGSANPMRAATGLAREAFFYEEISATLDMGLAKCYYSYGNMDSGECAILMECLVDTVPCGVFLGPGNPNNWSVKDKLTDMCVGNPSAIEITKGFFDLYAKMHAKYWKNNGIMQDKAWLRGSDWIRGEGKENWLKAQQVGIDGWAKVIEGIENGTAPVVWDNHLLACLKISFAKISWEDYQSDLKTKPYSLVHGDAHPHNGLWCNQRTKDAHIKLIDFEMVGLGSPAQELGQYIISHMSSNLRSQNASNLVQNYYDKLINELLSNGIKEDEINYTFDECFQEYINGGFGRWAWFIPLGILATKTMGQYFHDQLASFAKDHIPNPNDAPMPRV